MSESTKNTKKLLAAVFLGSILLLVFSMGFFSDAEIIGSHSVGVYHIEPFYEDVETLGLGLGSTTPIVEYFPPLTETSDQHIRQSIVLSLFSLVSDTILREPVRVCAPIIFAFIGVFFVLRFASKEKHVSDTPQKILAYVSIHPGTSLMEIVKGIDVSRGSVVYHLRKLLKERRLYKTIGEGHARYAVLKQDVESLFAQTERAKANPINERILFYLAENPDTSRYQIAENLDLSVSVVYWHLMRLEKLSLVGRKKLGRFFVYRLADSDNNQ